MNKIVLSSDIAVTFIDSMGNDARLAMAAWASKGLDEGVRRATEKADDIPLLLRYLMKHKHGTPFEAAALQFSVRAPIFVWREWHRHRIGFSYNEESARYKTLDPEFYVPSRERPMMKVDGWKPGRPKFTRCDDDAVYDRLLANLTDDYQSSYDHYIENLEMGIDPGLARDGLNVGIYSSCWVTTNPRSVMHFLGLRTHEPAANHPSYPLHEIDAAARKVEEKFKELFPITHAAFVENGREAP